MSGRSRRRRIVTPKRPPRAILADDRRKILRALNLRCRPPEGGTVPSLSALRLRAIVMLAGGSALRISEVLKLNTLQMVDQVEGRWKLRSLAYLRADQSKGRRVGPEKWTSEGVIMLSDATHSALRAYLNEARRREWMDWPPKPGAPLFVAVRGNGRVGPGRHRLSARTLQWQWRELQLAAGIDDPYVFHELRHDALTRCSEHTNGNLKVVADFGRCDIMTAAQYVHHLTPQQMTDLRNPLSFAH